MANAALTRVTGTVLKIDRLQGIGKASGEPYDFTQVKILVASSDVTEVTLPRNQQDLSSGAPIKGELVDYLVEFRINGSGKGLSGNVLSDFPEESSILSAA